MNQNSNTTQPSAASAHDATDQGARLPSLAMIRTDLANERTLLAYGRTALMLAGTGVSLVKFLDHSVDLVVLGWTLIGFGALVGIVGIGRFVSLKRRLFLMGDRDAEVLPANTT